MLRRRRAAQINRQSVPYGSTKVEYLETSGTQTILLDKIEWGYNGRIKTDLMWTNLSASGWQQPFSFAGGSKTSYINPDEAPDESDLTWRRWGIMGSLRWDYGADGKEKNTMLGGGSINQNVRYNIVKDGEKNYLDGRLVCSNGEATWNWKFYTKPRLSGDGKNYLFHGRYYYLSAIQDNKLRVNLIPSIDITGTPCMFDLVSRKNFYNAGTGQFLIPISQDFNNYTPVEYLESTGRQWIQTDYCPCSETKITSNCYFTQVGHNGRFFGNGSTYSGGIDTFTLFASAQYAGNLIFDFADIRKTKNSYYLSTGNHYFIVDKNGVTIDGKLGLETNHTTKFQSTNALSFFAAGGVQSQTGDYWKIYDFIISENNLTKHSFIPCLDRTGTPCMYDIVTQTPFYNAGTGDFLYPSPTSSTTYSMRRPQAEYAKMTDTGVRRLYHVPVDYEGSLEEYANEHGFKLLNETESPNEEGKYYAFRWIETDTELRTEWYETEPPADEFGEMIENTDEPQASTFNLRRPAPIDETVYTNTAKWAKMTDTGVHKIYHTPIGYEGSLEDYALENNYKRLIETKSPNEEGKYYSFNWVETDDTLTTEWFEVDPPQEEFI
jgi:hypothetical protein